MDIADSGANPSMVDAVYKEVLKKMQEGNVVVTADNPLQSAVNFAGPFN